jgi:hypothetical protein
MSSKRQSMRLMEDGELFLEVDRDVVLEDDA